MSETVSVALLQNVINSQKSLITIFQGEKLFIANKAFLKFFGASDVNDFKDSFRSFTDCFVPHPSYFNRSNLVEGEQWYESIEKFDKENQIVSMLMPDYEPHAFSVAVGENIDGCCVVTFDDITQTLIKRIMVENNATTDIQSGAYDKKYFLHVAKSYDDAALFNKKLIGISKIVLDLEEGRDESLKAFVEKTKEIIRKDDMLIRWSKDSFLLVCLIDDVKTMSIIASKLKVIERTDTLITSAVQNEGENISTLLKRVG